MADFAECDKLETRPSQNNSSHSDKGNRSKAKGYAGYALSVLFWIAIWLLVARFVGNELLLAGPLETLSAFAKSLCDPTFWGAVGYTASRIVITALISAIAGMLIGYIAYRIPALHTLCAPVLQIMKSAPIACIVVIILVAWGGQGAFITIIAFVSFPPFYIAMQQALAERPYGTERVLRLLGANSMQIFCACTWPACLPFFTAASKTAIAMSWRAGITAEILSLPLGSIGAQVYVSKLTLDSAGLLVWTLAVMMLSWVNEQVILWLLKQSRRIQRLAFKAPSAAAMSPHAPSHPLELDSVSKRFGENTVLDRFTLQVLPGEHICLMAPTGTGKSTALKLLTKAYDPDSGNVVSPEKIGVVTQESTLPANMTAFQNVALTARGGLTNEVIAQALDDLLPNSAKDRLASDLSGGMKRLTEIARAMLSDGTAIILDEPFAGLDGDSRKRACEFILENLHGRALIVATHEKDDATLLNAEIVTIDKEGLHLTYRSRSLH